MLSAVELDGLLGDVVFLTITVAFFTLAWALVRLCERIAGTETALPAEAGSPDLTSTEVKAA
jgi:hypothetical protein